MIRLIYLYLSYLIKSLCIFLANKKFQKNTRSDIKIQSFGSIESIQSIESIESIKCIGSIGSITILTSYTGTFSKDVFSQGAVN